MAFASGRRLVASRIFLGAFAGEMTIREDFYAQEY
jgi:hypothetical protein